MDEINWNELLEDPEAIEASPLERVIAVGQGRTVNGITVEFHALELRELGAFGTLRAEIPPVSPALDTVALELSATDDRGTKYSALMLGSVWTSGGPGSVVRMRGSFSLVPPIARDARRLDVRIARFGGEWLRRFPTPEGSVDQMSEPTWLDGPWEFHIPLD